MTKLLDQDNAFINIIGNGKKYKIPPFQRDYSWTEEQWEDLWNDFLSIEETKNHHYMGSIVLQNNNKNNFIVVDGQQRLTTLTIYAISTIAVLEELIDKNIDAEKNQERILEIERAFIGHKTMGLLSYESKLTLNKNNDRFFQDFILKRKEPFAPSKLKDSERELRNCYLYFKEKIKEKFVEDNGEKMAFFLEDVVAQKMIFIRIVVDDEIEAYTIFETLNARGVDLTTTDLIKNYLFIVCAKTMPESQMVVLEDRWNNLVHKIGLKEFPTFLRYYINSKQKLVRQDKLFKVLKSDVKNSQEVLDLLDELSRKEVLYNALKDPNDDFWNDFNEKDLIKKSLSELKLFGSTQQIPLLFATHDNLLDLFPKILRDVAALVFRYNTICKKNPNDLEKIYNLIAQKIHAKEIVEKGQIHQDLKEIYVEDEKFKQDFSRRDISSGGKNKKLIKYILTRIENQLSGADNDWNDSTATIEHILPENPNQEWEDIFNQNANKFIFRIGNYTLLEDKLNRKCSDKNYETKKEYYKRSKYQLTQKFCLKDSWDVGAIDQYQEKLADIASSVWKIHLPE